LSSAFGNANLEDFAYFLSKTPNKKCIFECIFCRAKKKKPLIYNGFLGLSGGNGGIRTLDEALHPILP
jgi:hypothetical protein